jgi:hypothetical protein
MKTTDAITTTLAWLRDLPEAGTIATIADKEDEILERRRGLLEQIAAIDARLDVLRTDAERLAREGWTKAEIADAKAARR